MPQVALDGPGVWRGNRELLVVFCLFFYCVCVCLFCFVLFLPPLMVLTVLLIVIAVAIACCFLLLYLLWCHGNIYQYSIINRAEPSTLWKQVFNTDNVLFKSMHHPSTVTLYFPWYTNTKWLTLCINLSGNKKWPFLKNNNNEQQTHSLQSHWNAILVS